MAKAKPAKKKAKAPAKRALKKPQPKKPKKIRMKAAPKAKSRKSAPPKKAGPPARAVPKAPPEMLVPSPKPAALLSPPRPETLLTYEKFPEIKPVPLPKPPGSSFRPGPVVREEPITPAPRKEEPKKPAAPPIQPIPPETPAIVFAPPESTAFEPDLDQLPAWEDRLRLKRLIFEDSLTVSSPPADSADSKSAREFLAKGGKRGFRDVPNYFLVCIRDRDGRIIAAMDGHITNDILVILRSSVSGQRKRELHIILCAAAMTGHALQYVLFAGERKPLDFQHAGELILLGRGFGMSAFVAERLLFVRRVKKELDPLSNGQEVSKLLDSMVPFMPELGKLVLEYSAKNIVALSPLPTSPDSREHLHELRDAAESLGLIPDDIDQLMEDLRHRYVYGREDITPESL